MHKSSRKEADALFPFYFILVLAADQLFKRWIVNHIPLNPINGQGNIPLIPGVIHLTHIHNYGAAFSMLEGARWFFLVLLCAFCVLVVWALRSGALSDPLSRVTAVLAAAGAVGNGIDRAFLGYVVDMFEVEFMDFAVFNVADAVMCVCCALFVIRTLTAKEEQPMPGVRILPREEGKDAAPRE